MLNASIVSESGGPESGFGQSRHRSGYDHDGDGFTELPLLDSRSVGMRSIFRTGAYSRITAQYHHLNEVLPGRRPAQAAATRGQHCRTDRPYDRWRKPSSSTSVGRPQRPLQCLFFVPEYGPEELLRQQTGPAGLWYDARDLVLASGLQYVHAFERLLFMPSGATIGGRVQLRRPSTTARSATPLTPTSGCISWAAISERVENVEMVAAARRAVDKHNLVDHVIFSPRVNVRFNPSEAVNLRGELRGGYPAPQAFDERHAHRHRGRGAAAIRLADDLKEERSLSVSLSGRSLTAISEACRPTCSSRVLYPPRRCFSRCVTWRIRTTAAKSRGVTNGSGATVAGVNVEGRAVFTRWFELRRHDLAAEPLCPGTRAVERGSRFRPCSGCSARRPLRLLYGVVQALRRLDGRRDRDLHGRDARAAHEGSGVADVAETPSFCRTMRGPRSSGRSRSAGRRAELFNAISGTWAGA